MGWTPINELMEKLPWTISSVTSQNVHKLVYKLRSDLKKSGIPREIIEENKNGYYRLGVKPDAISIKLA